MIDRRKNILKIVPGKTRKLQIKFFVLIILTILATMLLVIAGFYGVLYLVFTTAELGSYAEAQLEDVSSWLNILFGAVILVSTLVGGLLSFRLSHRIAGPLYRIEKLLTEMIDKNELIDIKLRPKDELQDIVELLNKLLSQIKKND